MKYLFFLILIMSNLAFAQRLPSDFSAARNNADVPHLVTKIGKLHVTVGNYKAFKCSGTFISESGIFVSGAHCLWNNEDDARYFVRDHTNETYELELLERFLPDLEELQTRVGDCVNAGNPPDECMEGIGQDIAIFKVSGDYSGFDYAALCSHRPEVGDTVFSVNFPAARLNQSEGIVVEGEGSEVLGGSGITVTAFIDGGSSGGALFNEHDELCGITNSQKDNSEGEPIFGVATDIMTKIESIARHLDQD